jgi:hypothetical protein
MENIRQTAVAGMFYPADATELSTMIHDYLQAVDSSGPVPKAIIAPHAGYIYSGPVAASAYHLLEPAHDLIKRVVLLGPSHHVPFRGLAACHAEQFATPLGMINVDTEAIETISHLEQVIMLDQAHSQEHSLEVHIPFLQSVLDDFMLVPLVVGDATPEEVSEVLDILWGGDETLIVISSDLSHYHEYHLAKQIDSETSKAIEELRWQDIGYDQACGRTPVTGLIMAVSKKGIHCKTIDLRNSGDTAGPKDRVVGYGAYVFR